jgi:hypothetical protein
VSTITLLLAFYGALLSTFVFVAARLDQRPRIRTSVSLGFSVGLAGASRNLLLLEAVNVGRIEVTLASWSIRVPTKRKLIFPLLSQQQFSFPCELKPGKSCTVHIPLEEMIAALKKESWPRLFGQFFRFVK